MIASRLARLFVAASLVASALIGSMTASAAPASQSGGTYIPITPTRVLDTRDGTGLVPRHPVSAGSTLLVDLHDTSDLPYYGASAVVLNLTVARPSDRGWVTVYGDDVSRPRTSNLSYSAGQKLSGLALVAIPGSAQVEFAVSGSGHVQLIADLIGYYAIGKVSGPGGFVATTPRTILNTNTGIGAPRQPVQGGSSVALQVSGRGGIPADGVAGVALDVTVSHATSRGSVAVYGHGSTPPRAVSVSFINGKPVTNLVVSRLGEGGMVDLGVSGSGEADLRADVVGYWTTGSVLDAGGFVPTGPSKILSTQSGLGAPQGAVSAGATLAVQVAGRAGVPATGAGEVAMAVTVTRSTGSGSVTAYPRGTARPATPNLFFTTARPVTNLVVTRLGRSGEINLHVSGTGQIALAAEVVGYHLSSNVPSYNWGSPDRVDPSIGGFTSISCPTTSFCAAVDAGGHAYTYTNGTWSKPKLVADGYLTSISCVSASFCAAVYEHVYPDVALAIMYNGTTWSAPMTLGDRAVHGVSCASSSFCVATADISFVATYNGSYWSEFENVNNDFRSLRAVSCPDIAFCVAVGSSGAAFEYDGATWSTGTADAGGTLEAVSCPTSSFCAAVDDGGNAVTYDGSGWTDPTNIDGTSRLTTVSCPTSTACVAFDQDGNALTFDGDHWTAGPRVFAHPSLSSVSCPTTTFCLAAHAWHAQASTFNSGTWDAAASVVQPQGGPAGVSCVTASACVLVDASGAVLEFDGAHWSTPVTIDDYPLTAVSCPTSAFCAATDNVGNVLTLDGGDWTQPQAADPGHRLTALSCAAATFCVAVDDDGNAITYSTGAWSGPTPIDAGTYLTSVSCSTSTACVAVGGTSYPFSGDAVVYDEGTWSPAAQIDDNAIMQSISCASATTCLAVGAEANSPTSLRLTADGWRATAQIPGTYPRAVSCADATHCAAVDQFGGAVTSDGYNWSVSTTIDPGFAYMTAISCPTEHFCAATSSSGDVILGT